MGHMQTVKAADVTPQNAAFHLGLFCLLGRNFIEKKNEIEIKYNSEDP